jgi:hypothetical protein
MGFFDGLFGTSKKKEKVETVTKFNLPPIGGTLINQECPECKKNSLTIKARNTSGIAGDFIRIDLNCSNCGYNASPCIPR